MLWLTGVDFQKMLFLLCSLEIGGFIESPLWDSVWCSADVCSLLRKHSSVKKKHDCKVFCNDSFLNWTQFAINSRNHYQNPHPDPYRISVGIVNSWKGRPRVVPWPIWFERVVPKRPGNHHYFWVCTKVPTPELTCEEITMSQNIHTHVNTYELRHNDMPIFANAQTHDTNAWTDTKRTQLTPSLHIAKHREGS